jgi:hypothetical protein
MANMNVPDEWYQWGDNGWEVDPGWWENNHDIDIPASIQANLDLGPLYQTQPQSPDSHVGPALMFGLKGGALTAAGLFGSDYLRNLNQYSVPMEGPMRFAGRGIPKDEGRHYIDAPDGPYFPEPPGYEPELIPMPMPRFPTLPGRAPIHPPLAAEPYIPPSHSGRHPPDSTMIVPEVVYPPEDTRSEWEKWKDSFRDDWRAK